MLLLQVYPFFHFRLVSFKHLSLNTDPASNKKKKRERKVFKSQYRIYSAIRRGFHLSRMTTNNLISSM